MSRSVPEWIGKTHDTRVPDRVRVRVFDRVGGHCHRCSRKIAAGEKWTCEHLIALKNARHGDNLNRESNLDVTCDWCLPEKNAEDVADKSKVYQLRKKHIGASKPKRGGFQTNRDSSIKMTILHGPVDRRTGEPIGRGRRG